MKKCILLSLVFLSIQASAILPFFHVPANSSNWKYMGSDRGSNLYLDVRNVSLIDGDFDIWTDGYNKIHIDEYKAAWIKKSLNEEENLFLYVDFYCNEKLVKVNHAEYINTKNSKTDFLSGTRKPETPFDTPYESIFKEVCFNTYPFSK